MLYLPDWKHLESVKTHLDAKYAKAKLFQLIPHPSEPERKGGTIKMISIIYSPYLE